jgi:hypothetical protein
MLVFPLLLEPKICCANRSSAERQTGSPDAGSRDAQFDAGASIKVECILVKIVDVYNKYRVFCLLRAINRDGSRLRAVNRRNKPSPALRILFGGVEKAPRVGSLLFPSRPALLSRISQE